jgi:LmbE family N-acetylglucosaminyl deacetylase
MLVFYSDGDLGHVAMGRGIVLPPMSFSVIGRASILSMSIWSTVGVAVLMSESNVSHAGQVTTGAAILKELRSFATTGSALYVAAHPDDENTQVITYLARGRGYRTAYLSLTRGDGGQNLLGPQLGEVLGVARTQELLAARRLDGGRQFFTRAKDFGYSKTAEETLAVWDRQAVLGDIVRVIREFRPDVIITRFPSGRAATHGHHTASAVLAVEAFRLAADPTAFPEQLGDLQPWQARRIVHNVGRGIAAANPAGGMAVAGLPAEVPDGPGVVKLDVGGRDPVSGESFGSIAARSRGMHKTQGFDLSGPPLNEGSRIEPFVLLAGDMATRDLFDGVDTTWARIPGAGDLARSIDEAIARFNPQDVVASVPALLAIRRRLAVLPTEPVVADKRAQLDRIIQAAVGLQVDTVVDRAEVVPGETVTLHHRVVVHSRVPVRWTATRYPSGGSVIGKAVDLRADQPVVRETSWVVPPGTPPSQPYWLRRDGTAGLFAVDDPSLIGRPEDPPVLAVKHLFEVGGQRLEIGAEPMTAADPARPGLRRRLTVIAPVSLRFISGVQLFGPGTARPVVVEVTAARAGAAGTVQLDAPAGWTVTSGSQRFRLGAPGDHARFTFAVIAPPRPGAATLTAQVEINGRRFDQQRVEVRYDHLPVQVLQPSAHAKSLSLELATRGHHVGYVPGAGDEVPAALEEMGYAVTSLTGADLTPERLRGLDAVVIGVRAFNVRTDLAEGLTSLFAYVEAGGTVVAQYNTLDRLSETWLAPFQLQLSRDRVTDEHAPVTILAPGHHVLTQPNRIAPADFDGWVQERGLYFPSRWDERFTPIVACSDPGEGPLKGGLLVARHGNGYFVYTSLAWFRQLPEGVPGAYRVFANLVSLGK